MFRRRVVCSVKSYDVISRLVVRVSRQPPSQREKLFHPVITRCGGGLCLVSFFFAVFMFSVVSRAGFHPEATSPPLHSINFTRGTNLIPSFKNSDMTY